MTAAMGRKPLDEPERRDRRLATYVTASELTAVDTLSAGPYQGTADVLRKALALLIVTKHPELVKNLRDDLKTP